MIDVDKLKAGDVILRIAEGSSTFKFTKDKLYKVVEGDDGIFVREDDGSAYRVPRLKANAYFWEHVEPEPPVPSYFSITDVTMYSGGPTVVTLDTDEVGFRILREMENDTRKHREAAEIREQIERLERKLEELEGDD